MRVAILTTFAASRKEPVADTLDRIHRAFLDAGLGEPAIRFTLADSPLGTSVSSVDRVLKRHPELARFVLSDAGMPGIPGARVISNVAMSLASDAVPYATLHGIAGGVPRSFPFHSVIFHLHAPAFGELVPALTTTATMMAGVMLSDSWWVNGRVRALSACTLVDADPGGTKLPPPPPAVAAVLAACGKARKTIQAPLPPEGETRVAAVRLPTGPAVPSAKPDAVHTVHAIVADYRARMSEIVTRAALPHDLPPQADALRSAVGLAPGPKKPALERVFKPMAYSIRGGSGTFSLRRRTPGNLTLELSLDVGTWSNLVLAIFRVWGVGFKAAIPLPVAAAAAPGAQYPIGDAVQWQKIVENLAALVAQLERTFVPDIEAAAGPSPAWYQPES